LLLAAAINPKDEYNLHTLVVCAVSTLFQ